MLYFTDPELNIFSVGVQLYCSNLTIYVYLPVPPVVFEFVSEHWNKRQYSGSAFPFLSIYPWEFNEKTYKEEICDKDSEQNSGYNHYFSAMRNIYQNKYDCTCSPVHKSCGWPVAEKKLPLFVLSVGLEGPGHHIWTELFENPLFDCVWWFHLI